MRLTVREERWPIRGGFRIARGAKSEAVIVLVEVEHDGHMGRGECVPYARFGHTVSHVVDTLRKVDTSRAPIDRNQIQSMFPAGAARNALDCALWDLEAKMKRRPVWQLAGLPPPTPSRTGFTISLGTPEEMGRAAKEARDWPLLKLKLDAENIGERLAAVRENAPSSDIVVDANESWTTSVLEKVLSSPPEGVMLIEQPLPAKADPYLTQIVPPIPLCADESAHTSADLPNLQDKYQAINIKLDKSGGLTQAIHMARQAKEMGFDIMLGCMVATSLAMAPAMMLTPLATWVDLDGPALLSRDRQPPLGFRRGCVFPPSPELWG